MPCLSCCLKTSLGGNYIFFFEWCLLDRHQAIPSLRYDVPTGTQATRGPCIKEPAILRCGVIVVEAELSGLQTGLFGSLQALPLLPLEGHRLTQLLDHFRFFLLHFLQVLINHMRLILGFECPVQEGTPGMVHSLVQVCRALCLCLLLTIPLVRELLLIHRQSVILHLIQGVLQVPLLSLDIFPDRVVPLDPSTHGLVDMRPQLVPEVVCPDARFLLSLHHVHDKLSFSFILLPLRLLQPVSFLQCQLILLDSILGLVFVLSQLFQSEFHGIQPLLVLLEVAGHRKHMQAAVHRV